MSDTVKVTDIYYRYDKITDRHKVRYKNDIYTFLTLKDAVDFIEEIYKLEGDSPND